MIAGQLYHMSRCDILKHRPYKVHNRAIIKRHEAKGRAERFEWTRYECKQYDRPAGTVTIRIRRGTMLCSLCNKIQSCRCLCTECHRPAIWYRFAIGRADFDTSPGAAWPRCKLQAYLPILERLDAHFNFAGDGSFRVESLPSL